MNNESENDLNQRLFLSVELSPRRRFRWKKLEHLSSSTCDSGLVHRAFRQLTSISQQHA